MTFFVTSIPADVMHLLEAGLGKRAIARAKNCLRARLRVYWRPG
jgi:hypothetical protein